MLRHQLTLISSFQSQVRRICAKPYQIFVQNWLFFNMTRQQNGLTIIGLSKKENKVKGLVGNRTRIHSLEGRWIHH